MLRIVLTGPESSGKTSLAQFLARTFDTGWVPEFARTYLTHTGGVYDADDLVKIAIGQVSLVHAIGNALREKPCVFLDTWLYEIRIWSEYRFRKIPPLLDFLIRDNMPDAFLLCAPDLPWVEDPLRENPDDRDLLFRAYREAIEGSGVPFFIVSGDGQVRQDQAIYAVRKVLSDMTSDT